MMKKNIFLCILLLCFGAPAFPQARGEREKSLLGFSEGAAAGQRHLESQFDSSLKREDLRHWLKQLSARPHHVGSARGKENAEFIASLFSSWGFKTAIEEFDVLFPTPKTRLLEMTTPVAFTARLAEPPLPEDSTSNQTSEQLPVYNAYSIDGDVRGELVYVNYGIPSDYETLEQLGVNVKGKIAIARYGGSWRGIKPKVAAEHGAIGCIIYSDPRDDGFFQGDIYPKGAYRGESGAQRGSVADMPLHPGDPLTPFVGATKDAKRLPIKEAKTLTKIPVLPISYSDALPLLASLRGPVAPEAWRGALPVTYHLGPGPATVHLKLAFNWDIVPAYDVIASIEGSQYPDEWIIRGNHHDGWVNGAADPLSGQVAMLEEAKGIGGLMKSGWKPKRTIKYCAWDGEEPGLLGSTEWVEAHADALKQKGVVYINSDTNGRGFLFVAGSHSLEKFINQVARDVIDPEKGISVAERLRATRITESAGDERKEARDRKDLRIGALGSGSDYTPFLQHLGVSALNIGYGGENGGGSYHSIYDSFDHYIRFDDSSFVYGIALAQTGGRAVLRLAGADLLPFDFSGFVETVGKYIDEVSKLADEMRTNTEELNQEIKERSLELASDPKQTFVVPHPRDPVPHFNFAPLQNALTSLKLRSKEFEDAMTGADGGRIPPSAPATEALNALFIKSERSLTGPGLPRRPWFVHEIYAPGAYTGYGVKTLPGVREAIEQRNWKEAEEQIGVVAGVLERYSEEISAATKIVNDAKTTGK
ncbi:MAG TPA: transferrin receptor-like dimerization domain-containing protein [Bacteroidota bacterium]|nr:transferrin receptor-like dimerization domain-containing protein [Bacteroidota bacterium]